jgi:putative addiction module component (TIGR02574 family)
VIFATEHGTVTTMALPAMPPPGFDELTAAEKLEYVQTLWDRVASDPGAVPVADWQREILAERLAAHRAGQGSSRPWEDVRHDLLARLRAVRG